MRAVKRNGRPYSTCYAGVTDQAGGGGDLLHPVYKHRCRRAIDAFNLCAVYGCRYPLVKNATLRRQIYAITILPAIGW
jgi:hypothetical protein